MNKKISKEIPAAYRKEHTSSISVIKNRTNSGSGEHGMAYCWQGFDGCVYFVVSPLQSQTTNPTVQLYINETLVDEQIPPKTYVGDGYIYVILFNGLSNGDEFFMRYTFTDENYITNLYTYIGDKGEPPFVIDSDSKILADMSTPYNKTYSMAVGVLTFNSDYGELNSYSREARNLLYTSCLQYTEYNAVLGKVGNFMSYWVDQYDFNTDTWGQPNAFTTEATIGKFMEWDEPLKVGIASSSGTPYYSEFSTYVNEWINDINILVGRTLFKRDDTITENESGIRITIGTHEQLWGYNPDMTDDNTHIYFGSWECTRWYPDYRTIQHCEVKLCNELRGAIINSSAFKDITYEELTECLGCGNDTYHTYESMFSEIWYIGKKNRLLSDGHPTIDGEVVQMLYNELEYGEVASEVIHKLTPSTGATIQLPNEKYGVSGRGYSVKAYAMNRQVRWEDGYFNWDSSNNCFSNIGSPVIITPSTRPRDFVLPSDTEYALRNNGEITKFTKDTWNNLINKVLEFVEYKKYSSYEIGEYKYGFSSSATLPQLLTAAMMTNSDKEMTARRFNLVRYCIGNMNPFGTGTNSIKTHANNNDGRWDMNPGEEILGDYFLDLVTYLNDIE